MAQREKHAYCFKFPNTKRQPVENYNEHAGTLVFTLAVSPKQAANNAIYSTFHPESEGRFKLVAKYLHSSFDLSQYALDIDELDRPVRQSGLFGGTKSSHRRLDERDISQKISRRFGISNEGESSIPKQMSRKYIQYRAAHPLTK